VITTPGGTISAQYFTNQTADETLGPWIDVRGRAHLVFYVTGTGTLTGGVITFEEASPLNWSSSTNPEVFGAGTGGYSSITTATVSDVTAGLQKAYHPAVGAYCFVRARISTVLAGGGSVSCGLVAY
jgi:hypothetical protein